MRRLLPTATEPIEDVIGCHISDLHLTADAPPIELTVDARRWPESILPDGDALERRLGALRSALPAGGLVFCTGDATDSGGEAEWQRFHRVARDLDILMVPGNHDLLIGDASEKDSRTQRYADAESKMASWDVTSPIRVKEVVTAGGRHVTVIGLDTNRYQSRWIISNAVGFAGSDQLAALRRALEVAQPDVIVMMHHHVALAGDEKRTAEDLALLTLDAGAIAHALLKFVSAAPNRHVLVLHGHRHVAAIGALDHDRIRVCGLPSSTMGNQLGSPSTHDGLVYFAEIGFVASGNLGARLVGFSIDEERQSTPVSREDHTPMLAASRSELRAS